jgi:hypothetical protein
VGGAEFAQRGAALSQVVRRWRIRAKVPCRKASQLIQT